MEGIERIKRLSQEKYEEISEKAIKRIAEYLVNREDLDEKFLNEDKNLQSMYDYIHKEAQRRRESCMDDEEVYSLAVHYWDESNEDLGIVASKKKESKKKETKAEQPKEEKKAEEVPKHKDDDIVMRYQGRDITYKEFIDKSYLKS